MLKRLSRRAAAIAALAGFCSLSGAAQAPRPTAAPGPTLVVFLTIDQMRSDYFSRFDKQLTGRLARLYPGGAFFSNGWHAQAITHTAPDQASPPPAPFAPS